MNNVTINTLLQGVWGIVLQKYSNTNDVVFGSVVSGRNKEINGIEEMLGLFINNIPIRVKCQQDTSFLTLVQELQSYNVEMSKYDYVPLVDIQSKTSLKDKLVNNIMVFENYPIEDQLDGINNSQSMQFDIVEIDTYERSTYNLNLIVMPQNGLKVKFAYNANIFDENFIERLGEHFLNVIKFIVEEPTILIKDIDLLSSREKQKLLYEFNNEFTEYAANKTLVNLFEEQVIKTPDKVAVVFEDKSLTYTQLNEMANKVARTLRNMGVEKETIVGIILERSLEMPIAMIGVLKAGAAYLPIDHSNPEDRINYIIKDSGTEILVTKTHLASNISFCKDLKVIDMSCPNVYDKNGENLGDVNNPSTLAYIIYTSGSTGNPKGVMIEHKSITQTLEWRKNEYKFNENHRVLPLVSYAFDGFVTSFFTPIVSGAKVVILSDDEVNDVFKIKEKINSHEVTHLVAVPSMCYAIMGTLTFEDVKALEAITVAGEALTNKVVEKCKYLKSDVEVINEYGPTENSVITSIMRNVKEDKPITIGKPKVDTKVYVLDKDNNLQPIGVPGELCISGNGLARGYLNRIELTEEKFIKNPFEINQRLYKTGDLARWCEDGNIEFIGRIDNQVKIRGFRIELGEIENVILKHENIKDAVVIDKTDKSGSKYLCAYVMIYNEMNILELRGYLTKNLPDYMIPTHFVQLDIMPRTLNGKINKKALLDIDENINSVIEYKAPTNDKQEKLIFVWQDVLGIEKVGIKDNFFELGGDSIKAIQVIARLKKYGYILEMKDLFKNPVIEVLSGYLKDNSIVIDNSLVEGGVELIPIQKWFFEQNFTDKHHWNQSVMLYNKDGFEEDKLIKVFDNMVVHHDALRMIYEINNNIKQVNRGISGKLYTLESFDFKGSDNYEKEIKKLCTSIQSTIDLNEGPLMKLGLFKTDQGDHLLISIHHLIIDGVSWRILFEDFTMGYNQALKNEQILYPDKTSSYKQWATKLKEYASSNEVLKELDYWKTIAKENITLLPRDYEINEKQRKLINVKKISMMLSKEETEALLKNVNKAYNTEINDILLTTLALTIKEWTGTGKIVVNLEGHGREAIFKDVDITRTIGWFTAQYPVILDVDKYDSISYQIKYVKETLRHIPNKGIGYGILKYLTKNELKEGINFNIKPQISFNYLGQFDSDIKSDAFELSSLSSGYSTSKNSESLFAINASGIVADEKLSITFSYNDKEYSEKTILNITENYMKNLRELINHCTNKQILEMTPTDLGDEKLSIEEYELLRDKYKNLDIKSIYPLSPMQEGMFFHALYNKQSKAYFESNMFTIIGNLDVDVFQRSFNTLINRHEILRTVFVYENVSSSRQIVFNKRAAKVRYEDISNLTENLKLSYVEKFIEEERTNGFDLTRDMLIKVSILKTNINEFKLIWSHHHILMDGWCISLILGDFFKIYYATMYNHKLELESTKPYINYVKWLQNQNSDEAKAYWKKYVEGYDTKTSVPIKKSNVEDSKYSQKEVVFKFDKILSQKIDNVAKKNQVTVNTVIQAIWGILLQRYNNIDDVIYGAVVSGRNPEIEGIEKILGLFINTIPIRIKSNKETTFREILFNLNNNSLESSKYDYYSLAQIQAESSLKNNLLDHIMIFENYPVDKEIGNSSASIDIGFEVKDIKVNESTNYDFNIVVMPNKGMTFKLVFNELVYDTKIIEAISRHFINTASILADNPEIQINSIEIIDREEKEKVLYEFNDNYEDYEKVKTVHQLFEEQVEKTPNNIAVVFEDKNLSYEKLNEKANKLARTLRKRGVKEEAIVAIIVERSLEMVIGMMAVLKAGGAYLPIDPSYPKDRIKYMLEDSKTKILISKSSLINSIDINEKIDIVDLEDLKVYDEQGENLNNSIKINSLAYIIYTSGSTGNPKGVMIEHKSIIQTLQWRKNEYELGSTHNVLNLFSNAFDGFVTSFFTPIISGSKVVLLSENETKDVFKINEKIKIHEITHFIAVPSMCNAIMETLSYDEAQSLKVITLAGEALTQKVVERCKAVKSDIEIVNEYGPTENSVVTTILRDVTLDKLITIGKPKANTKVCILDKNNNLQPIGMVGELCISGYGLARGYLNRIELTEQKFIKNPFNENERLYKTGDLARWCEDGNIEFIGRIDEQVKIRGFRIELGEIETVLLQHENISETVVIDRLDKNENKYLCAYFVGDKELFVGEIRAYLLKSLPDYMVPLYFVKLEKIPVTANGKVDKKSLPNPEEGIKTNAKYICPRNDKEEIIAKVWQEVLEVELVGIKDNFFELGGDSIKAIQIMSRLKKYGYTLEMKDLFKNPDIESLSSYVKDNTIIVDNSVIEGTATLSPIQSWFFEKNFADKHHFNQAIMMFNKDGFNKEILEIVFNNIVNHHDALRMAYKNEANEKMYNIKQLNKGIDEVLYSIETFNFRNKVNFEEEIINICNKIQGSFDLSEGPLMKLALFNTVQGDHLLIVIHHLVVDAVSWRILFEDFTVGYKQVLKNEPVVFNDKTTSYKEWTNKLKEYADSRKCLRELSYWETVENTKINPLPKDYNTTLKEKNNKNISIQLSKKETENLLKHVNKAYNTEINDILLTALAKAINSWTNDSRILINLEGHGREQLFKDVDITRTIGWFTTQYPLVLNVEKSNDMAYGIKSVKETLRHIPGRGIGYGILRYLTEDSLRNNLTFKLNPEISFNYLGQFDKDIRSDMFEISKLSSGNAVSRNNENLFSISISGMIANETLNMSFSYNGNEYKEETISKIAENYKENLLKIINHCINIENVELTPSDFGDKDLSLEEYEYIKESCENNNLRIKEIYPLSPMQEGMLFHGLFNKDSSAYFEKTVLTIEGGLNINLFEKSFNMLIDRYDILRTVFVRENLNHSRQVVFNKRTTKIYFEDIRSLNDSDKVNYVETFIENDTVRGFDLSKDMLMRVSILKTSEKEFKVIWCHHHTLMDGWCIGIILGDFFKIYHAKRNEYIPKLNTTYPYKNYINWLQERDMEEAKTYWKKHVKHYDVQAAIPRKSYNIYDDKYENRHICFKLDETLTAGIEKIAKENNVTINTIVQAIWGILLQRYNNVDDVIYGTVVSGRNPEIEGIEQMVGLFINTIPVRIKTNKITTFKDLIIDLNNNAIESSKYDYYPLAEIQALSTLKNNLIDHIMIFENYPVDKEICNAGSSMEIGFSIKDAKINEHSNYNFDVVISHKKELTINLCYNANVYDDELMMKTGEYFKNIAIDITKNNEILVSNIEIVREKEKHQLIYEFNDTKDQYINDKTIHELFEEQVEKTPNNIVVVYKDKKLTYKELNDKANKLAWTLRKMEVKAETIVSIMVEPCLDMIVALIAILKAGGAYLPIDSSYPEERIKYMLEDSKSKILLTQTKFVSVSNFKGKIINLEDENNYDNNEKNLENISQGKDLVYVIYTSGSTGNPKGVMIEHRNLMAYINAFMKEFNLCEKDTVLQQATYCFDGFVDEVYPIILTGGKFIIVEKYDALDMKKLEKIISKHEVNVISCSPLFLNELNKCHKLDSVHTFISGGEVLKYEYINRIIKNSRVYNTYGPTEATVCACYYRCNDIGIYNIPIGKPIANYKTYILDKNKNLVPIGMPGELYIAGDGLARGYLNNPKLTNERFISNTFVKGEIIYKTGDLVRWLPDGNIEFLGRIDDQIKIRGFRIEIGEIEKHLLNCEFIRDVVVVCKKNKNEEKYLCAYIVANKEIKAVEIKEQLAKGLPQYMIPSYFIQLDKMPLNSNGKIDRKALPEVDESFETRSKFEAPRNEIEQKLTIIWSEILGAEKVGILDNFFELGGHSLKATVLTGRIHKELNVEVPIREIFKTPTIKGLGEYINKNLKKEYVKINKIEEKEYYEVSSAQKRMYTLQQMDLNSIGYNMPMIIELRGRFDKNSLEKSMEKLIARHETLRTSFDTVKDEIVQIINNNVEFKLEYTDLIQDINLEKDKGNKDFVTNKIDNSAKKFIRSFDLSKAPLLRVKLIKVEEDRYILMFDTHHIISDGVSSGILINEFVRLYGGEKLEDLTIQYKDFAHWQNKLFKSETMKLQEEYWVNRFNNEIPVLNIPTDFARPLVQSFEGDSIKFNLGKDLSEKLKSIAKETESTMYMVFLGGVTILLSKYSGQEDIIIGSPIAGRPHADLENVIGMFVNTLAMRNSLEGEKTCRQFLKEVRENALMAYENQDYQFEELVEKLNLRRDISRNPLFDVMFSMQNIDNDIKLNNVNAFDNLKIQPYKHESGISKFDLTIEIDERDEIQGNFQYSTKLFKRETIIGMIEHFKNILQSIGDNLDNKLCDVQLLGEKEKNKVLYEFNNTNLIYQKQKTICELFEEQVIKNPNDMAVIYENEKLTYKELNEKANKLARSLRDKGVTSDTIVAIMVERSVEMIVGIMAILKAGGAYLPVDSEYPIDRIMYVIENSKVKILLTQSKLLEDKKYSEVFDIIEVINLEDKKSYFEDGSNLKSINSPKDLAYVIYTSGSTGKAKGVMVEQRNVINLVNGLSESIYKRYNNKLNIAILAPYFFDASVQQIFACLLLGHSLFITSDHVRSNGENLIEFYSENNIDLSDGTPIHLELLLNTNTVNKLKVKHFIIGGDTLSKALIERFTEKFDEGKSVITNIYGPTECCVDSSFYTIDINSVTTLNTIPIGKPLSNQYIYILDKNRKPIPVGVNGELYISGDGVSRGYLDNSELTNEKFIENPFVKNERMYRTGDLARWLPDGNIEFIGRIDHQVKIRGYRIELGEIENSLLSYKNVKEVVVIDLQHENTDKYLCAYIVADNEIASEELREHLSEILPTYMIPSYFIKLDKLPLTPNGKVDRKALPRPDDNMDIRKEYKAPRNDKEEKLVKAWQEVLGVESIGIRDNFFELGGDSIKAIQVMSRLKRHGYTLEMKDLFRNPTIEKVSKYVSIKALVIEQGIVEGEVDLTPIQKWFFEQDFTDKHQWNQAVMLYNKNGFAVDKLRSVFDKIAVHHDALRMSYKNSTTQVMREVNEELYTFEHYDFRNVVNYKEEVQIICNKIQGSINLSDGPLMKLGMFKTSEGDHLLIAIHHLIIDGVSWRIIFEDFTTGYKQAVNNEDIVLTHKTTSYKKWAEKLKEYSSSKKLLKELEYWKTIENQNIKLLPKDNNIEEKERKGNNTKNVSIMLSEVETEGLLKKVNRTYNTEINDILLTALGLTIKEWTGENKVLVNLEGHGREQLFKDVDITRTIGWFTEQYPIILDMDKANNLSYEVKNVKEALRHIPNKGIGYGILKYLTPNALRQGLEFKLKPEISFNYLGQFDEDIKSDVFEMSNLSSGHSISKNNEEVSAISINGIVAAGKLNMFFIYNDREYKEETIYNVAEKYKKNLCNIIEYCINKEVIELTPTDLGDTELTLEEFNDLKEVYEYNTLEIKHVYPLSPMQEGMLFHSLLNKESEAYFEKLVLTMNGQLDIDVFERSFNELVNRHDIFRTVFAYDSLNKPRQIVYNKRNSQIYVEDVSDLDKNEKLKFIEKFIKEDTVRGFNLSKDILIRVSILKTDDKEYKVVWSHHHILMDGWCIGIIFGEFFKIYHSIKNNYVPKLNSTYPYIDYINWLQNQDKKDAEDYWTRYVEDYNTKAVVPTKAYDRNENRYKQKEVSFGINEKLTAHIEKIAKNNHVTINTVIQAIWGILLQRYNNVDDVIYGAVVSGRNPEIEGIEQMVGLFINTIPVRVKTSSEMTFKDVLLDLNNKSIESNKYDYYPLAEIQAKSNLKNNLIDNIMVFQNYPLDKEISKASSLMDMGFEITNIQGNEITNYDFNVVVAHGKNIVVSLDFNEYMYDSEFVEIIGNHFTNIAQSIANNENIFIKDIEILTEEEKDQLLYKFNDTTLEYEKTKTIHQRFEEQVQKAGNSIAVVFEDKKLTYLELNEKANKLARTLREKGVKQNSIVGIMVQPSLETLIGIMAILKAGGAYLPINSEYPKDRIKYMLEDSEAKILLTESSLLSSIDFSESILNLDDVRLYEEDKDNLHVINTPYDLAYIIYTSGSTGKPKGVMIEHKNVLNLSTWFNKRYNIKQNKNVLQMTNISFDVSVEEVLVTLLNGGTVYIPMKEIILDKGKFKDYVNKNKINIAQFVPTTLNELIAENDFMKNLSIIICGGDKLDNSLKNKVIAKGYKLYNHYGPTEITVDAIITKCDERDLIGKPVENSKVYIINKSGGLQPIDIPGEIYIGGDGLARGYLNNEKLTEEKFVENPFIHGERLYRTGDLGRWVSDGNIEFLGRIDHQVKIRGFRIELGEIENELLKHELIKETVVIDRQNKNGEKYLCAYIVSQDELTVGEIREHLSTQLPEYMVPSYFVKLEKMPLTSNGKIDRKALPEPEGSLVAGTEYEAPRNEIEEKLVLIWNEILGISEIGINNSFFELGGHSLKTTVLSARIRKEFNVEIPLKEIFKSPTIKAIGEYIRKTEKCIYESIRTVEDKAYYISSSAQKRMYMLQQFNLQSNAYNMPTAMVIEGVLDKERLEKTFNKLIERHESLRTSFETINDEIVQKIKEKVQWKLEYVEKQAEEADEFIKNFVRPFDLSKAPLLRVALIKIQEDRNILMYDMHHIISDGVSTGILTNEFVRLYKGENLEKLRIQYKDYSEWQNSLSKLNKFKKQEEYWINVFSDEIPALNMPTDYARPAVQSFKGDNVSFKLDKETTDGLRRISKETGSTMYMMLLSAVNILLSKYSGQEDIVVGTPIAGIPHADLEKIIGMFVNTLAMRDKPEGNKTYEEFLKEIKENCLKAYENQDYQFEELVDKLNLQRDISRNPLFDVMFTMNHIDDNNMELEDLVFKSYKQENNVAKFDLTFTASETDEELFINLQYCTELFRKETIQKMVQHFNNILCKIIKDINIKINEISMLSNSEREQLLYEFNDTYVEYPKDKTLHGLFEEQVQKTPDNIAVIFEDKKLTYRELNEKSNRLAVTLREKGVKSDSIVGIMVEHSIEMIVGMFGILKAGGAYLPIDLAYPEERIKYMLENSKANILLTQNKFIQKVLFHGEILDLEETALYSNKSENLQNVNTYNDLAYVIYTSGSTGRPKGVMIEHRSIAMTLQWRKNEYKLSSYDSVLQLFSNAFDGFITSFYTPIISGAKVVILNDNDTKDIFSIKKNIAENKITHFISIPSMCLSIMEILSLDEAKKLKVITLAGESVTTKVIERCKNANKDVKIMNEYGPTENSVVTTIMRDVQITDNISIGKPKSNTQIYILSNKVLNPIGVVGEICISGQGLARGYCNNEKLTIEKFVENPFISGTRMYRTGDLGRWLPDGNIEFLGRIDHQVKVRGFRIELGEIESQLLNYKIIKEAIVIDRYDKYGSSYLCAYIVAHKEVIEDELRVHLLKVLPNYMIPTHFMQLDKMPLNSNGKVDRKALPEPGEKIVKGAEYEAPRNAVEEKLQEIWSEVLGVESIGIKDNFFELGGHSLKAMILSTKIHKEFDVEVPIIEIFKLATINEISRYISKGERNKYNQIPKVEEQVYYPLSRSQKRLFVLNQLNKQDISYNMPMILQAEGRLDIIKLENAFKELINRHEIFRTSFEFKNEEPVQIVNKDWKFKINIINVDDSEVETAVNKLISPFDLSKSPLLRANYIITQKGIKILMIDMHHIVSDGLTMQIFIKELVQLYKGNALKEVGIQYKDFSTWQNNYLKSDYFKELEKYWLPKIKDLSYTNLPRKYESSSSKGESSKLQIHFNKEQYSKIDLFCKENLVTKFAYFNSILNIILMNELSQTDITIGIPVAGRNHNQLQDVMGLFLNVLLIRTKIDKKLEFKEYLKIVNENLIEALNYQDYPYEELYDMARQKYGVKKEGLFSIMLNYMPYQGNKNEEEVNVEDISFKLYNNEKFDSKYDVTVYINETEDEILINIVYKDVFENYIIERISKAFHSISDVVLNNEGTIIKKIKYNQVIGEEQSINMIDDYFDNEEFLLND